MSSVQCRQEDESYIWFLVSNKSVKWRVFNNNGFYITVLKQCGPRTA